MKPAGAAAGNGLGLGDLTSVAAAVAALLTALGGLAVTGVLERAQRDEATWLFLALLLVIVAALAWLLAVHLETTSTRRVVVQFLALFLFAGGLVLGIVALLQTQGTTPRPSVTASIDEKGLLTGSVKAESLKSRDVIAIQIEGLRRIVNPKTQKPEWAKEVVSSAYLGPNVEGKIEAPVSVLIPTGSYESVGVRAWVKGEDVCQLPLPGVRGGGAGCRILPLAVVPRRPRLSLGWSGPNQTTVDVKVHGTNSPRDRLIVIRVQALAGSGTQYLLRSLIEPDTRGVADAEWRLPVPPSGRIVCAEARFIDERGGLPPLDCPVSGGGPATAVAELRVP